MLPGLISPTRLTPHNTGSRSPVLLPSPAGLSKVSQNAAAARPQPGPNGLVLNVAEAASTASAAGVEIAPVVLFAAELGGALVATLVECLVEGLVEGLVEVLEFSLGLENAEDTPTKAPTTVTTANAKRNRFVKNIIKNYPTTHAFSSGLNDSL